jgi:hypothetical protein
MQDGPANSRRLGGVSTTNQSTPPLLSDEQLELVARASAWGWPQALFWAVFGGLWFERSRLFGAALGLGLYLCVGAASWFLGRPGSWDQDPSDANNPEASYAPTNSIGIYGCISGLRNERDF